MNRRQLLLSVGTAAVFGSGCLGAGGMSDTNNETSPKSHDEPKPMCDNLDRLQITCEESKDSGFELSILHTPDAVGGKLRVSMKNSTSEIKHTGNRYKYDIQRATEDGWESVFWTDPKAAWTDEGVTHEPDSGFTWEFEFAQNGLSRRLDTNPDYSVCNSLSNGEYRFVYFGYGEQCITKLFTV